MDGNGYGTLSACCSAKPIKFVKIKRSDHRLTLSSCCRYAAGSCGRLLAADDAHCALRYHADDDDDDGGGGGGYNTTVSV